MFMQKTVRTDISGKPYLCHVWFGGLSSCKVDVIEYHPRGNSNESVLHSYEQNSKTERLIPTEMKSLPIGLKDFSTNNRESWSKRIDGILQGQLEGYPLLCYPEIEKKPVQRKFFEALYEFYLGADGKVMCRTIPRWYIYG